VSEDIATTFVGDEARSGLAGGGADGLGLGLSGGGGDVTSGGGGGGGIGVAVFGAATSSKDQ